MPWWGPHGTGLSGPWVTAFMVAVVVLVLVATTPGGRPPRERYGNVLGAAAPYKDQYLACVRACERQDPRTYPGASNQACGNACDALISEAVRSGVPPPPFTTEFERCDGAYPGEGVLNWACVAKDNVRMACRQKCAWTANEPAGEYVIAPDGERVSGMEKCMRDCTHIQTPNEYLGPWIFR